MSNANPLQLLRSNTANKRPDPTALADGRPAVNTNAVSPGLFFKDSAGNLVKVGPVHVGTTAPNASPASGGATGNSLGEQWLDTTGGVYVLKIWDGSAWRSETGTFVDASGDTMTGALVMDNQQQVRFREVTANGTNYIALQAPASVASDKTITLPDVNGTVVTTGDTGTVTSTMIADATIVDADISASAEIAVSKLADGTARQLLQTDAAGTGVEWTSNVDVPGTLDVTGAATFDSTVAVTGALTKSGSNVVTVGDTGTVTSTMILDGTIVNADVNASAAIAGTKISPDFGSQNVTTTGTSTSASFIPTSSAVPTNGVYLPAANSVAISTGGSGRLFVDASGNVKVGSTDNSNAGSQYMTVGAPGSAIGGLQLWSTTTGQSYVQFGDGTASADQYRGYMAYLHADDALTFGTASSERLRITSAGLVGVGTSSPGGTLDVGAVVGAVTAGDLTVTTGSTTAKVTIGRLSSTGNDSTSFRIRDRVDRDVLTVDAGNFVYSQAGTERLRIDSSGRVGIGTTSPSATLQVSPSSGSANFQVSRGSKGLQINQDSDSADPNINTIGTTALKFLRDGSESMRIDTSGRLLVGTSSYSGNATIVAQGHSGSSAGPAHVLLKLGSTSPTSESDLGYLFFSDANTSGGFGAWILGQRDGGTWTSGSSMPSRLIFSTAADGTSSPTERMRIDSAGSLIYGTSTSPGADITSGTGFYYQISNGFLYVRSNGSPVVAFNRGGNDGTLVEFKQDQTIEGTISVSGTTVSYNGAHLSRWSQLPSGQERTEILRGSVLSNIDEMCEWGNEENEQLNRMKVSDVEGDKNVSGVFQTWDDDDDIYTNDFYCAMTGDFIIRIGAGVTVERGDLLMSAGDGTAKPQDDDIIRSKTIAKVTSTNVSCTYDDGSYCVPCVLMAC